MKVTQEKLPASQVGLEIEVTPEMSQKVYERVVQEFARSANIPGFRKGKVPRQVLIQRIGSSRIKAAAVEELVEDSLKEAVKQEKIEVLGNYQLRSPFEDLVAQFEPGQALIFSASVDVQPEVTVTDYNGLQIQAEEVLPDLEQVEQVLQNYQDQLATLVPVEGRPAQMKDVAVVDFKGVLPSDEPDQDPEEVPGGQAENFQLELLEGRFIEGFIDGIVGMNLGETKDIEATFPESYPQPIVAGRKALFTVTLKELKEKEFPELDDDFAQEVSEFETLAELRQSLEERFTQEAADKTRSNQEDAILQELLTRVEAEIPETLIEREVNYMLQQTAMQLQNQGVDVKQLFTQELVARLREQSRPDAIARIKRTLGLGEIAKQEAIEATDTEIQERVNQVLQDLGDSVNSIDPERLTTVVAEDVIKEKIMDWLIEHATIELVPVGTLTHAEDEEAAAEVVADTAVAAADQTIDTIAEAVAEDAPPPVEAAVEAVETPEVMVEVTPDADAEAEELVTEATTKRKRSSKSTKSESEATTDQEALATAETEEASGAKNRKTTKKKTSAE